MKVELPPLPPLDRLSRDQLVAMVQMLDKSLRRITCLVETLDDTLAELHTLVGELPRDVADRLDERFAELHARMLRDALKAVTS